MFHLHQGVRLVAASPKRPECVVHVFTDGYAILCQVSKGWDYYCLPETDEMFVTKSKKKVLALCEQLNKIAC